MASIPGILGYVQPGAFSRLVFTFAGTGNPNGIRSVAIIGLGRREEYLVTNAAGNGTDGLPVITTESNNYNHASIGVGVEAPNGMNFQTTYYPIVTNQFRLYKNGGELIRSKDTVVTDAEPLFMPGTDFAVDFTTGQVMLAPAYAVSDTQGTGGYFELVTVPANVPSEVWTIAAFDQPSSRSTVFTVVGSKSGQVFGYETFQEQRNYLYANGLPLTSGGLYYYDGSGQRQAPPATSFMRSDPVAFEEQGYIIVDVRKNATVTHTSGTTTATIADAGMTYAEVAADSSNFVEFVYPSDPNRGYLYPITAKGTGSLTIDTNGNTAFSTGSYTSPGYVVVSSDAAGQNFYSRSVEVYGANKLSSSRKSYYVRIFDSLPTDLLHTGEEAVYMSPGQALYEVSDDYVYDERTGKWTGTWYRGPAGTGLVTNESDRGSLGRQGSVPVYTSAGEYSGLVVNFAPASGVTGFDDLTAYYDVQNNLIPTNASAVDTWVVASGGNAEFVNGDIVSSSGSDITSVVSVVTTSEIASVVSVANVATLTSVDAHGLVNLDSVTITNTTNFNGTYSITVTGTNTFTFAAPTAAIEYSGHFVDSSITGLATLTSDGSRGLTTGRRVTVSGTTNFNGTYTIVVTGASTFTFPHAAAVEETAGYFTDASTVNTEFTIVPDDTDLSYYGWTTGGAYNGYILGTLSVTVNGVSAALTEIPYDQFIGRSFRLAQSAPNGATIIATFTVGDYSIARMTGMRKGDMWQIDTDGNYNNGMISFSLVSGENPFSIGDTLTIDVKSGALKANDNLVASYIAEGDVNDPEEFFEPVALYKKHGYPSAENTLALGAQLAFLNGARSVVACQGKPTQPTITNDILLVDSASGNFVGNGGLYYTAHTHGSLSFTMLPEDEYEGAKAHGLMHARDNRNALTTIHRHDDANYSLPAVTSTAYRLSMIGNPYNDLMNFFYQAAGATRARQVFLNRVHRSVIMDSTVSIPCTKNFGYSCNTSGLTIPSPLHGTGVVTADKVNNPFFLNSMDSHYLWIYPDGTTWYDTASLLPSTGAPEYDSSVDDPLVDVETFHPYISGTDDPAIPVFEYPDEVRNQFSTVGMFPDAQDAADNRFLGYDHGTAFPCGANFRLRSGLDVNVDFGASEDARTYTEIDSRPIENYLNSELAFNQTCTDNYDSVVGHFLKSAYNGGNNDPNNITVEDAMLYMHTQRDDMSYMIWTDNSIILSDRAGLRDGEGLEVHFVDTDDAAFVDPEWGEAAAAMESSDAYWIVPLPDSHFSAVQQTFRAHVESMSSTPNRRERQLLTGAFYVVAPDGRDITLSPANLYAGSSNPVAIEDIGVLEGVQGDEQWEITAGLVEDIANYGVPENFGTSYRTVYFYPDKIVVSLNGLNTGVPGIYMAAAAGGYLSGQQYIAEPLTWKNLIGFTITRDRTVLTGNPTISNRLGAAGITVVHGLAAGGKVLHCKSTIQSGNAFQEEPSSINIADLTVQELRNGLSAQFIGKAQTPDLPHQMLASTKSICQSLLHRKLLNNFDNIQVAQDTSEPRQYNVRVEILPVLPLLWIYIEAQVGL